MAKGFQINLYPNPQDNHIFIQLDEGGKSIMLSVVAGYNEADVWLNNSEVRLLIDQLTSLTTQMALPGQTLEDDI